MSCVLDTIKYVSSLRKEDKSLESCVLLAAQLYRKDGETDESSVVQCRTSALISHIPALSCTDLQNVTNIINFWCKYLSESITCKQSDIFHV